MSRLSLVSLEVSLQYHFVLKVCIIHYQHIMNSHEFYHACCYQAHGAMCSNTQLASLYGCCFQAQGAPVLSNPVGQLGPGSATTHFCKLRSLKV